MLLVQIFGGPEVQLDRIDNVERARRLSGVANLQKTLHNIDIVQRIDGLKAGDNVRFNGEYVWKEKGGVIHWTHHDRKAGMSQVGNTQWQLV